MSITWTASLSLKGPSIVLVCWGTGLFHPLLIVYLALLGGAIIEKLFLVFQDGHFVTEIPLQALWFQISSVHPSKQWVPSHSRPRSSYPKVECQKRVPSESVLLTDRAETMWVQAWFFFIINFWLLGRGSINIVFHHLFSKTLFLCYVVCYALILLCTRWSIILLLCSLVERAPKIAAWVAWFTFAFEMLQFTSFAFNENVNWWACSCYWENPTFARIRLIPLEKLCDQLIE